MSINFAFSLAPLGTRCDPELSNRSHTGTDFFVPADLPMDPTILTALLMPTGLFAPPPSPETPVSVSTADFSDTAKDGFRSRSGCGHITTPDGVVKGRVRRGGRKRARDTACSICLDIMDPAHTLQFPCGHELHRTCAFALLCLPVLGGGSMMRCPMCRYALDRYDMGTMGLDVSPLRLVRAARRTAALRVLATGSVPQIAMARSEPALRTAARLVQDCQHICAADGFVYNCAVLALERALCHRRTFAYALEMQLRGMNTVLDVPAFISNKLACHIEVLMKTHREPTAT